MKKKIALGFIVTFIALAVLDILGDTVLFKSSMASLSNMMRPKAEVEANTWILLVSFLVFAYFFSWIFSKGYEGKGILEGIRYGVAVGLMFNVPYFFTYYAMFPFPLSFTLPLFLYWMLIFVILGILVAWVFGMKSKDQAQA